MTSSNHIIQIYPNHIIQVNSYSKIKIDYYTVYDNEYHIIFLIQNNFISMSKANKIIIKIPKHKLQTMKKQERQKNDENHSSSSSSISISTTQALTISKTDQDLYLKDFATMKTTMQMLLNRVSSLEDELKEVKKHVYTRKKKIPFMEWLRENIHPQKQFKNWVLDTNLTEKDMLYVCENGIINGLLMVLRKVFPLDTLDEHPIRAFKQKQGVFFVYMKSQNKEQTEKEQDKSPTQEQKQITNIENMSWKQASLEDDIAWMLDILCMDLQRLYLSWREKHVDAILNGDKYYETKDMDYRLVLTSRPPKAILAEKIRPKLFNYLQYNLKEIVKMEFTY